MSKGSTTPLQQISCFQDDYRSAARPFSPLMRWGLCCLHLSYTLILGRGSRPDEQRSKDREWSCQNCSEVTRPKGGNHNRDRNKQMKEGWSELHIRKRGNVEHITVSAALSLLTHRRTSQQTLML